jgi:hypothetical protein
VRDALADAPERKVAFRRCRGNAEFYLLTTGDGVPAWVYNGECGEHGVLTVEEDGDLVERAITDELLALLGSPYGNLRP